MKRIILISCVSLKRPESCKAKDLYISTLFRKNLAYARTLHPDQMYILSAKYGLVDLDEVLAPYNVTLNTMRAPDVREWAKRVLVQLSEHADLDNDEFTFLAGINYRKYLIPHIRNYKVPLEGLRFGEQLHQLTQWINANNEQ